MNKSKAVNDIILIVVILLSAALLLTFYLLLQKNGAYVIVTLNGNEYARYLLSENIRTDILSGDNSINTLVIDDGEAYISYANCINKICVSHRKISRVGETIVCLPHKLIVSIESSET